MLAGALCVTATAAHRVNRALEARVEASQDAGGVGALPDGKALRVLALGFDRLLADLFWLRTVYYIGDERSDAAGYPDLERLGQLVTDIDPEFRTVYVVMSSALTGLRGDPDAAIRLLEKGVKHVRYWKLHFLLGFTYFIERVDYESAARHLTIAANEQGSPPYLPLLASRLYNQAGDPETALAFIGARLREAENPSTRAALEKRYWDLWITRDVRRIDAAIAEFSAERGAPPREVGELVAAGLLEREPRDPEGGAYRIEDGRAATDLPWEEVGEAHVAYAPTRGPSRWHRPEGSP